MMTRRNAVRLLSSAAVGAYLPPPRPVGLFGASIAASVAENDAAPPLAPGTPFSRERMALIDAFKTQSQGFEKRFEARTYTGDFVMPYRLFRPETPAKAPLVVYLHGSGGLGTDNQKQLGLGNIFGTGVWLSPENLKRYPCFVLAPQTDRGWVHYDPAAWAKGRGDVLPGLGDGSRLALAIIDALRHELPIDERQIFVAGQSMGGAGAWNMISNRPGFFAAAAICCGSISLDDGSASIDTPLWNFHGDADKTVPVAISRARMAARRKAGGHPLSTEYAGVDHNVWEWAFTEPKLATWLFSQRRA